jgi:hypothetical protein
MPNWVYNSLSIEGSKEDILAIKSQVSAPFTREHEQFNIKTGVMETKDYIFTNPIFAFWNIIKPTDLETYRLQRDFSVEEMSFAGNNWYDWNVRNWGTKWDVAVSDEEKYMDTELMEEGEGFLAYRFNTAWSPPAEAITKLSIQYPTLNFNLSYEEETGWGGEITLLNGFITTVEEYGSKCKDCESLDTLEYCDNDCGEICSDCNYMGEADLDQVAECEDHKIYLDNVPEYRKVKK